MVPFLGQIQSFSFNYAPVGWAQCNGQLLSISEHKTLYSIIGTTYGGDGKRYFALPDMRGRSIVHTGQGKDLSNYAMGQTGGVESIELSEDNLPSHSHSLVNGIAKVDVFTTDNGDAVNETNGGENSLGTSGTMPDIFRESPSQADKLAGVEISGNTSPVGSSEPCESLSPYLVANVCIALQGTFPKGR